MAPSSAFVSSGSVGPGVAAVAVGGEIEIWNPDVIPSSTGASPRSSTSSSSIILLPPTNPDVELIRRRSYEKFKRRARDAFRSIADWSETVAESVAVASAGASAKKKRVGAGGGGVGVDLWSDLPAHAILERWHLAVKTEEAELIRERNERGGRADDVDDDDDVRVPLPPPLWDAYARP